MDSSLVGFPTDDENLPMIHKKDKNLKETRSPAVAGHFYPADLAILSDRVESYLGKANGVAGKAFAAIVPHAGFDYSGFCAAQVFARLELPPIVVIMCPNHTGFCDSPGASIWARGDFDTPIGPVSVAEDFAAALAEQSRLVADDHSAHRREHAIEVELPFIEVLAPDSEIVPLVIAWDDWKYCKELADDLVKLIEEWPEDVLLLASSDMTHFESAERARRKDQLALQAIANLDGRKLLSVCRREKITMCGRAPAAIAVEAARQLGATETKLVDYRNSSWVTGDDSNVVAYAGIIVN